MQVIHGDAFVLAIPPLLPHRCWMKVAALGVESPAEHMVSFLFVGNPVARATTRISLPQDRQEGCLTNFGGNRAASALSPTLLAAPTLCCATWPLELLQGFPVKLHVAVFFATLIAIVTLSISRRQSNSFTTNANTVSPLVAAMVPHVFVEGDLWQILFAA